MTRQTRCQRVWIIEWKCSLSQLEFRSRIETGPRLTANDGKIQTEPEFTGSSWNFRGSCQPPSSPFCLLPPSGAPTFALVARPLRLQPSIDLSTIQYSVSNPAPPPASPIHLTATLQTFRLDDHYTHWAGSKECRASRAAEGRLCIGSALPMYRGESSALRGAQRKAVQSSGGRVQCVYNKVATLTLRAHSIAWWKEIWMAWTERDSRGVVEEGGLWLPYIASRLVVVAPSSVDAPTAQHVALSKSGKINS
ncbi:hypothetical protein FB451DRAFT_1165370 [Mycena latifolia]|nr:hypothetical protein FB451DRAFT_1165370 [Mycena latifolia]